MGVEAHPIRTPDQRLRVFVSSTLKELAPERRAARTAIERLRLAPVMFELGARPHPPRELYRAYLEQSDVFVGLYWERYGWVAPGEAVSGLEDEYDLCPPEVPRLLYIKDPAVNREPRLTQLLDRIRGDDLASFKYFATAKELGDLVAGDLSTLLAERFDSSRAAHAVAPSSVAAEAPGEDPGPGRRPARPLPVPLTELIGREEELALIDRTVASGARLITLTGPGGIGKSRLAIGAAAALAPRFPDGAVFVDVSAAHDPESVQQLLAQALGVRDTGDAPLEGKLLTALRERSILLVIDNFEQVLHAGPMLTALLTAAPGVVALMTSRRLLRVGGERSIEVRPLPQARAVELFVERAHAVKPDFELTTENTPIVARICTALDGLPLALELAAARIRVLTPGELLDRLDRRLPLLVGGSRDLPERQQTLRRAIAWSTDLLGDTERRLLSRLAVFEGGFGLEAAEFLGPGDDSSSAGDADVLGALSELVDSSLVSQHDAADRPRFSMLATVREFGLESLDSAGGLDSARDRHAEFYRLLAGRARPALAGSGLRDEVLRLSDETDNLRAAIRYLFQRQKWDDAAELAWSLYVYWWVAGLLGEVRGWMEELLASPADLSSRTRAIGLYFTRAIRFWQDPGGGVVTGLAESAELFHGAGDRTGEALARISIALALLTDPAPDGERVDAALEGALGGFRAAGDRWGEGMALVTLGRVALLRGQVQPALERFEESLAVSQRIGDELGETIGLDHRGWARLLVGDGAAAAADFHACTRLSARLGHAEGIAYGLEGLVAVAALGGDPRRAGLLLGAATALRERTGLYNAAAFAFYRPFLERFDDDDTAALQAAVAEGRDLSVADAVEAADA